MHLTFRQGIARYQTDVNFTPTFLKKSSLTGDFIDLIVSPDPTVIIFANKQANYIVEETKTVLKAWGPFQSNVTCYLYWNINRLTGVLTRDFTLLPPITSDSEPANPQIDQHWFNTNETIMNVWNGSKWVEKIRVFAAKYSSAAVIVPFPIGSQTNIIGGFKGGAIVFDEFNKPLRQYDGTFVTTTSSLTSFGNLSTSFQIETQSLYGMANEYIAKFSLVQLRQSRKLILGRTTDPYSRIAGMVIEDLYENEPGMVVTTGIISNDQWNFDAASINRPFFCGPTGQLSLTPPITGVCQIVGFIYDNNSIFMDIKQAIILDNISISVPTSMPIVESPPIADFTTDSTIGITPLTVVFSSTTSGNPTMIEWDFNNDGTVDAVGEVVSHTFIETGKYSVRLHAANEFGQDDSVKNNLIKVLKKNHRGINTNLSIQLGGPDQVKVNSDFSIAVTSQNDGYLNAELVYRKLVISNYGSAPLIFSNLPAHTTEIVKNGKTTLIFAAIELLEANKPNNIIFTIRAPSTNATIEIDATIYNDQVDSEPNDNAANIKIVVKP